MIIDPKYTKAVSSLITSQTEKNTLKSVLNNDLKYTLCDRTSIDNNKGNYFMSFGLPYDSDQLSSGSTMSKLLPELYQLNVNQIIVAAIPSSGYSESIDGRTITMAFPQSGETTPNKLSAVTIVSSTYFSDKPSKGETSPLLGDNIAYLFCDAINKPYTGKTENEFGDVIDNATRTSWNPTNNFLNRPSAIAYSEVKNSSSTYNTDKRTSTNYAVPVETNYPDGRSGYNYDIPVGFVILDKGFVVITHPQLVNNFPWNSGYTANNSSYIVNLSDLVTNKTDIHFNQITASNAEASKLLYNDVDTSFKTTAVCLAMPREFYASNNPTWNREKLDENGDDGIINVDSVFITEIGLYNGVGEMVAVAKLSEPVEKEYTGMLSFTIDLEM